MLVQKIDAVRKPVDEEDLISYIIKGLNPTYHPFITSLNFATRDATINFDDFLTKLLNYEHCIESQTKYVAVDSSSNAFSHISQSSNTTIRINFLSSKTTFNSKASTPTTLQQHPINKVPSLLPIISFSLQPTNLVKYVGDQITRLLIGIIA